MKKLDTHITWDSPGVELLAQNYTMPAKAEDLSKPNLCLGCKLAGGKYDINSSKCTRKDNSAKPELDKTLSLHDLYYGIRDDCENSVP